MGFLKKVVALFITLAFLLIVFVSCTGTGKKNDISRWMQATQKIKVLATTAIVQDVVAEVGGEHIDVIALVTGELDPHSYELVKGDNEKFLYAEILFANGLLLEHSASVQYQLHTHPNVLLLGEEILKKEPSKIIYVGKEVDPHIWMDLSLWAEGVDLIVEKLSKKDPAHTEDYQKNGALVKQKLLEEDGNLRREMAKIPLEKRYLVTSHDAFNYFVRRYLAPKEEEGGEWRKRLEALQGLAPDDQISALSIQNIVDYVTKHRVEVIFAESNLSQDSLHKVREACKSRGIAILIPEETLFGDALGAGNSHISMLQHNARVLKTCLGAENGR